MTTTRRVKALVQFYALIPDGADGDNRADDISDALVSALTGNDALCALGVFDESYSVVDWTEEAESDAA